MAKPFSTFLCVHKSTRARTHNSTTSTQSTHLSHTHASDLDDVAMLQPKLKLSFATKLLSVSLLGTFTQGLDGALHVLVRFGIDKLSRVQ